MISALAVETGIPPSVLLEQSPRFIVTMLRYMRHRAQVQQKANRGKGGLK